MKTQFLDLSAHANAHAATFDADRGVGFVNAWRNSFPAEEVPFGNTLLLKGIPFVLPRKAAGAPDHVEALGQEIDVRPYFTARAVGILGFGELGDQTLDITLTSRFGDIRRVKAVLPNWLVPRDAGADGRSWRASHLHYGASYELDHLQPALFAVIAQLSTAIQPVAIRLGLNPLAHVMAVSLLSMDAAHV
ncbi:MAG: hypothetical protein PSV46_19265 [Reyranella sp.]|nr:hypothetical protein [Reyranella sp.]